MIKTASNKQLVEKFMFHVPQSVMGTSFPPSVIKATQSEIETLRTQLAKADERVKELEKELANKELLHVGFTNGSQIKYAKVEEGAFYPDTDGDCYIPLYMLKSHEHRIETTSIEQLRKEQNQC